MTAERADRRAFYLRVAAGTGLPFGVLWGSWFAVATEAYREPARLASVAVAAAVAAVLFGAVMAAVLGTVHLRMSGGTGPVHASEAVDVRLGAAAVLGRLAGVGPVLGRARIVTRDAEAGLVVARAGVSWRSWGERIEIRVEERMPGLSTVTVSSRPVYPMTLLDYGINDRNVRKIVEWLANG